MAARVISFLDLKRRHAVLGAAAENALIRVARSGSYILGDEVAAFESSFARNFGRAHAVGVASGTDAISLALLALGIGERDEVLTVANACMPVVSAIRAIGAQFALADCDRQTRLLEPDELRRRIGSRTRAVVAPHLYGHPLDGPGLAAVCAERDIALIEDCAQAHGTRLYEAAVGSWGACATFSFYPTKNMGAYGDGGLVLADDDALAERLRLMRMYGYERRDWSVLEGRNSRLDELQAAILRVELEHLTDWVTRRRAIAARYCAGLESARGVGLPTDRTGGEGGYHLFVITVDQRDTVRERLRTLGVETGIHYPAAIHQQPVYAGSGLGSFPNAEWLAEHVLSLPCYPELADDEVDCVIKAVREAVT
jgi:dTDP-4-amino-4,6-dideoxygalactose transaminase